MTSETNGESGNVRLSDGLERMFRVTEFDHPEHATYKWTKLEVEWINDRIRMAMAAVREACKEACRVVGARYPTDLWPENGQSLDCKSARMARLTAANCEREIDMRSNAQAHRKTGHD